MSNVVKLEIAVINGEDPPDDPKDRELFNRIRQDIGKLPPGVVPDVPWDWNDDDTEGDSVRDEAKSPPSGQAGPGVLQPT